MLGEHFYAFILEVNIKEKLIVEVLSIQDKSCMNH